MSLCLVCSQSATVWCSNDAAFLCNKCDVSIHTSNAVASRHTRVPVCSLCNSKASSVYCVQDRAALCDDCDTEIHASNPLPHDVIPVHMMNKVSRKVMTPDYYQHVMTTICPFQIVPSSLAVSASGICA